MLKEALGVIRRRLALAILAGVCLFAYTLFMGAYQNAYTAAVRISFVYDGIDAGQYPDGYRFSVSDLTDDALLAKAYAEITEKGFYDEKGISLDDVRNSVAVSPYLSNGASITSVRALGYDYAYYANEYTITYTQPRKLHLRDSSDLFGYFRTDYSQEFLDALARLYLTDFLADHTDDGKAFLMLSDLGEMEALDYADFAAHLDIKADACLSYLYAYQAKGAAFISSKGLTLSDLINSYEALRYQSIQKLTDYVTASRLTRDITQTEYLYLQKVQTAETSRLKAKDESELSVSAMEAYDQNFTQNLIVVTVDEAEGLYQARPKTAYDSLAIRAFTSSSQAEQYQDLIAKYQEELAGYRASDNDETEYARMLAVAEQMKESLVAQYESLRQTALQTVLEYLDTVNHGYFTTAHKTPSLITNNMLKNAGKRGLIGAAAVMALILCAHFAENVLKRARDRKAMGGKRSGQKPSASESGRA